MIIVLNFWELIGWTLGIIGATLLAYFVVIPYTRMQARRRAARRHTPQSEEIWVQEGELLYIDSVGPTGVEVIHWDAEHRVMNRWKDTWPEWQQRLRTRVLWYSGQRRPLGSA